MIAPLCFDSLVILCNLFTLKDLLHPLTFLSLVGPSAEKQRHWPSGTKLLAGQGTWERLQKKATGTRLEMTPHSMDWFKGNIYRKPMAFTPKLLLFGDHLNRFWDARLHVFNPFQRFASRMTRTREPFKHLHIADERSTALTEPPSHRRMSQGSRSLL